MEWGRVKTILICVFFAVNAILFAVYLSTGNVSGIDDGTIDGVIEIMTSRKITIDKKLIEKDPLSIEGVEIENSSKSATDLVKIAFPDGTNIVSDNDDFSCNISVDKPFSLSEKKAKSIVKKLLKNRHLLSDIDYEITVCEKSDKTFDVKYVPIYNKRPFVDISLTVNVDESGKAKVRGQNWLLDEFNGSESITSASPITEVLLNFAGDEQVKRLAPLTVTNIDIKYYTGSRNGEISTVTALPVWQIKTDNGSVFNYDIRDGERIN